MSILTESSAFRRRTLPWIAAAAVVAGLPVLPQALPAATAQVATTPATGALGWGLNTSRQLGDGTTLNRRTAVVMKGVGTTQELAAGDVHSVALDSSGAVWTTGANSYGQLGSGSTTARTTVARVDGLSATAVAAGQHFSLAVRPDGTVAAWGRNNYGQLGNNTVTNGLRPVTVSALQGATAVAAGDFHSLAIVRGEVWAWGLNSSGQLGDGSITGRRVPVKVSGLTDVVSVAAGAAHSLAVRTDGSIWAWGLNNYSQLGDNSITARRVPVRVGTLSDATAVAAGDHFSMALHRDGRIRTWGRNASGQLGDGSTTTRKVPVLVSGITGAVRIAAGDAHAVAALPSGLLRAWGWNNAGQLGDGTITTRRTPVPVGRVTGASALAAGLSHTLTAGPPPLVGPQPTGWWSGEEDLENGAADAKLSMVGTGVTYARGAAGCGFVVPAGGGVTAGDSADLEPGTSFSVSGWLSPASVTGARVVAVKADATRTSWSLAVVDGKLRFTATASGTGGTHRTLLSEQAVITGTGWQHVTVVYNGAVSLEKDRVQLYVDGALVPNAPFTALQGPPSAILDLTAPTRFGGTGWVGGLDELRIFPDPLTAAQVTETRAEDLERAEEPCDSKPPVTTGTWAVPANAAGWHRAPVDLLLTADDGEAGTGVESVTWSSALAGAEEGESVEEVVEGARAVAPVTQDGTTTVSAYASDNNGNVEEAQSFSVRIDSVPPTLVGTRTPAQGGWTNQPVTVTWACADELSGVASCPAPTTVSGSGEDQAVTATVRDAAGNETTATVGDIDVDAVAPVLTGVSSTPTGWANDDVTVTWTATDALSGVDPAAVPPASVVTGEGSGLTASASVADRAGNVTRATSPTVSIDRTPPITTATAPQGWSRGEVEVVLTSSDALSGVGRTWWSLDGAPVQTGDRVVIAEDGRHVLTYFSVDNAGNAEAIRRLEVDVDATAPTVRTSLSAAPNEAGWHSSPVTVTFVCEDGTSGVQTCSAPVEVRQDGAPQSVRGEAVDEAGNVGSAEATINLDSAQPAVTAAADRAPDSGQWYAAAVDVAFACTDELSGVLVCPPSVELGEGAGQPVWGTAVDVAGNRAGGGLAGLDVDLTAPALSGRASSGGGWSRDDVTVRWTCSDAVSGVEGGCPADSVVTGEGELSVSASVRDRAGHQTTAVVTGVQIDRTAPVTQAAVPAPAGDGWHGDRVSVELSASDALSGVARTEWALDGGDFAPYTGPVVVEGHGRHELVVRSTDVAGNVEVAQPLVLSLDGAAPSIAPVRDVQADDQGWHTTPVTVRFDCVDGESGVATCSEPVTVAADGRDQQVTGTAVDRAGNAGTAVTTVSIDTVAPVVALSGPVPGRAYEAGQPVPAAVCTATDGGSGIAGTCSVLTAAPAGGVGTWTATATATDVAGHTATATLSWSVLAPVVVPVQPTPVQPAQPTPAGFTWGGWSGPLALSERSGSGTVTASAGSTLPVSFTLLDRSGRPAATPTAPLWLAPRPAASYDASATGTPMAFQGGRYRGEWKVPSSATGTWVVAVRLPDGNVRSVRVELR